MNNYKNISYPLIIIYSIFAYPFVIGGFHCNYIYILLPLLSGENFSINLKNYKLAKPFKNIFLIYFFIYLIGLIYYCLYVINDPYSYEIIIKQGYSFIAFVSIFSLSGYIFNEKRLLAFKLSILLVSLFLSLKTIYSLFSGSFSSYFWADLKGNIGTMRNGIYFLLSICIFYFDDECKIKISHFFSGFFKNQFVRFSFYFSIYILLTSNLFLTFSRTTYISSIFLIIIILFDLIKKLKFSRIRFISKNNILRFIYLLICSLFLSTIFIMFIEFNLLEIISNFLNQYLFDLSALFERTNSISSSEGYRLNIFIDVIRNTFDSPFIGTSYLGYWFIKGLDAGSAHSQHFDILMKTGLLGFLSYVYLNLVVFKRIYIIDKSIYYGLLISLIFGIFSETFRYGGLSFVFAVTISLCSNSKYLGINQIKN